MKLAKLKDGELTAVMSVESIDDAENLKNEGYKPLCEVDGLGKTYYTEYPDCIVQVWQTETEEIEQNNG